MNNLKKSRKNKVFSGVIGGLADKTGWDVSLLRLGYALLTMFTFGIGGIAAYIIAAAIIPFEENDENKPLN